MIVFYLLGIKMKVISLFLMVLIFMAAGVLCQADQASDKAKEVANFHAWAAKEGLSFPPNEINYRALVFKVNSQIIKQHNDKPEKTFTMAVNKFSGYIKAEFNDIFLKTRAEYAAQEVVLDQWADEPRNLQVAPVYPASVDWTLYITPVKDQGRCGSCWAFATTASIEAMYSRVLFTQVSLSEQELSDCTYGSRYNGCNGGWPTAAFKYVQAKKLSGDANYPYTARDQHCLRKKRINYPLYSIVSHVYYSLQGDCETTKAYLAEQPLAIAVDASDWSFYSSGVLSCTSTTINHGVLLVGYNELGNWHIKNSWGVNWGENGYIWLASGNSCAVCTNLWKAIVA